MPRVQEKNTAVTGRLNVRLSADVKLRVTRAANILGQDLTEFAVSTLNEKAVEVLERYESLKLSEKEYKAFLDILSGEVPEPTKKSLEAAKRYKRGVRKGAVYESAD